MSLPSQEQIDESVRINTSQISIEDIGKRTSEGILDVLQTNASLKAKNVKLRRVVDIMAKEISVAAVCKKGCSYCCHIAVTITNWEAEQLAAASGRKVSTPDLKYPDIQQDQIDYGGVACPFLKNNACSVYDARPLACRSYFNVSSYPELCDSVKYPKQEVPQVGTSVIWNAHASINIDDPKLIVADIRAFFPK